MFQYYIFDLYGTLVDIHTEEASEELWEKLCLFYSYYGALYHAEELKKRYREIISEMESGSQKLRKDAHEAFPEIQIEEVFRRLYQEKGVEADRALTVHTGQFFRVLSTDYVKLYEGTKEMLEALKKAGKKIYLLSNAQRIFTEYEVRALGIFEYFDGIMISSDYGMKKPDRKFFELLLDTYKIPAEEAIMVGNDGICDIEGAAKAGLSAMYIRSNISPKEPMPDAEYVLEEMDMEKVKEILLGIDKPQKVL